MNKGILTKEEHNTFKEMFPEVKSRCPVCYISGHIERKVKEAIENLRDFAGGDKVTCNMLVKELGLE